MNNNNYITLKLWDGCISLHRDFTKSTTLNNVRDDISHIIDCVAYEFLNKESILSNVGVTISQKGNTHVKNNDVDVLYIQRMPYYRYLVRKVLTFISDCFGYKIEENECDTLKQILFVEVQNDHSKIDSISYILIPSLLRIICYKLEVENRFMFNNASSVEELLLQTVKKYEKSAHRTSGVKIRFDSISSINVRFYFKHNYANLILPWLSYNRYFSDI